MIKPGTSELQFQPSNRSAILNKKKTKGKRAEANVVIALSVKQLTTPLAT